MARDLSDLSATLTAEGLFEKLWNENIAGTLDGKSRLFEESRSHANHPYTFEPNNPYLNIANPGLRGRELVREGKTSEAILALEAEVTADPECSEGWRMLGELHADNDQDVEAIECLKRGHQADPYNLESLMALGVSLANEFNQSDALGYLKTWLENHEDSCFGFKDFSTPLKHSLGDRKPQLMEMFRNACTSAPDYVNAHIAAGVVCNINQHTNAAFDHFSKAILNGTPEQQARVWNKLGATLANDQQPLAAVLAYKQSLALRPEYTRVWSNLGIAYNNIGRHREACGFYLEALRLNPTAEHLWGYLTSSLISLNR
eukprot:GHVN01069347.1.p1 GENE.GHVN01069347.1~~GHVN01069347.1.p1  ORF type:complete len:317 (-),score=21.78 GHVN01069347.1:1047-1997(-)